MTSCSSKIVVFDLDETLGYFVELGMFWDAIKSYISYKEIKISIDQTLFNNILDLYPEFLRPNIINILNYLKNKKEKRHCDKLMIYTNNQGPPEWANYIVKYFENKLNYNIFDRTIAAFKVQGKRVEINRTSHMKSHSDLIKCTKIPKETQICFIDDVYHPDMTDENIYYINVKPYIHDLDFEEMINRFLNTNIFNIDGQDVIIYKTFILQFMKKYKYTYVKKTNDAQNIDKIISKKILEHLHDFFRKNSSPSTNKNKTKKHIIQNKTKNKTLKNI